MAQPPVKITDSNIAELTANNSVVVVDCWAEWCGPCRMLTPIIEQLAEEYEGKAVIGKLNVDENRQTSAQHQIMAIPTILIFKDGKVVDNVVGVVPKQTIANTINKYL